MPEAGDRAARAVGGLPAETAEEYRQHEAITRITLRPLASPLPMGFLALAVGTFTLAGLQLSWVSIGQWRDTGLVMLTFVAPLQTLSAIYGFLARDAVAGTGMGLLAVTWTSIGAVTYLSSPGSTSGALGLVLAAAAAALLIPAASAMFGKRLASAVMMLAAIRFAATSGYELSAGSHTWKIAAGIIGVLLAALAWYAGLAFELEDSRKRTILPTLRRGVGSTAMTGSVMQQVTGVQHEAGVRQQL